MKNDDQIRIKALEDAYHKAMMGTDSPSLMMGNVPGVGFVVMTRHHCNVNLNEPATEDQMELIRKFFRL